MISETLTTETILLHRLPHLIVTTSIGNNEDLIARALGIAAQLETPYVQRRKLGLGKLFKASGADRALIVDTSSYTLAHADGTVYRYHPNLGFLRGLNLMRGQRDLFVDAAALAHGETVLDCTVGFGSEAILAAMEVGEKGRVVGLESLPELAFLTRAGLHERSIVQAPVEEAMRRIEIVTADYRDYLCGVSAGAFDLIYFDPFFHERTAGSEININPLLRFGNPAPLDVESVQRAIAIVKRRVLVKHPKDVELPDPLPTQRETVIGGRRGVVVYSVFAAQAS